MRANNRLQQLLDLYLEGKISLAEHSELMDMIATGEHDDQIGAQVLSDLQDGSSISPATLPPHISQEIFQNIIKADKATARVLPIRSSKFNRLQVWVAAAALLIIASAVFIFLQWNNSRSDTIASILPANVEQKTNTSNQPERINLADGSVVTLQPGSKLYFTPDYGQSNREVFLEGEAFFDVKKDPSRPFLVYYKNIVTRVLGTSFRVATNLSGEVEVAVSKGKVQVFENEKLVTGTRRVPVIVTPNQRVVYGGADREFETALVEKPQPVVADTTAAGTIEPVLFVYQQQPLSAIYADIEKKYGIEIVLGNTDIGNCVFSGDVSKQDMFTKLQIISLATNCKYEINGTRILITGEGCQNDKSSITN